MNQSKKGPTKEEAKSWISRFTKFNLVGVIVFIIATIIYVALFPALGIWTWLIANGFSSVLHFSLIDYLNRKKEGKMFEEKNHKKN